MSDKKEEMSAEEMKEMGAQIECDTKNYKKYPRVDDNVTYKIKDEPKDTRDEIKVDPKINLENYYGPFKADLRMTDFSREQLARMQLMAHEYFLLLIEAWAKEVAMRHGMDEMQEIQLALWGGGVLEETKAIKAKYMGDLGNDVAAFMKDIQIDTTSLPRKYFEQTFVMPEKDVGIMTFVRCKAVDDYEALGRPDILEKHCQSTCPDSMIKTAKYYNPNMKVEILAIPPRKSKDDVCCKWRLSMRKPSDPEYVKVNK